MQGIRRTRVAWLQWVFVLTMAALLLVPVAPALAAGGGTITVNSTGDQDDFNLADGVCDADSLAAGPQCTLRAAIENANASGGAQTIVFAAGITSLNINSELPAITVP